MFSREYLASLTLEELEREAFAYQRVANRQHRIAAELKEAGDRDAKRAKQLRRYIKRYKRLETKDLKND